MLNYSYVGWQWKEKLRWKMKRVIFSLYIAETTSRGLGKWYIFNLSFHLQSVLDESDHRAISWNGGAISETCVKIQSRKSQKKFVFLGKGFQSTQEIFLFPKISAERCTSQSYCFPRSEYWNRQPKLFDLPKFCISSAGD